MHPPRYHAPTWPDERVLCAIQERIERVREQRGHRAATELAVAALAVIDAELPELHPELRLLPARRVATPSGRLRRRPALRTVA